ncbi:MAG TPA: TlpA disulfide reductase family protein [Alphaproteobacteria bacterium]|nr:TlpA disulfide reductase family protein [Alphaproteobacteria bacterium]
MNRNILSIIGVTLAIAGLLFAGRHFSGNQAAATGITVPARGSMAPDFELKVLDGKGKTLKLSDLRGKAVVVNFWATYCGPCKIEMPWLVDLQKKYGPEGLQIVGIDAEDASEKSVSEFAHQMGVNYPIVIATEKVADAYGGVDGLPTTFFVDRSGKVVDHVLGLVSESVIVDNIKKSLASGGSAVKAPSTP